jgi:hypothetical protein
MKVTKKIVGIIFQAPSEKIYSMEGGYVITNKD